MNLPFTSEQFLSLFKEYNLGIWPAQIFTYLLGLAVVAAMLRRSPGRTRFVLGSLAIFWLWNGIAFHFIYFRQINPAAAGFAVLFVVQALLSGWMAFGAHDIETPESLASVLGWTAIAYGMVGYPLLNHVLGHQYPTMPVFGVAPCPTTIFTFGVLMLLARSVPGWLLIGPMVWAAIGTSAAFVLGIREDMGLAVAAGMALVARLTLPRRHKTPPNQALA